MLYLFEHEIRVTHARRQAGYSILASGAEDMNLAMAVIDKNEMPGAASNKLKK